MAHPASYTPTPEDLHQLIRLLHDNGVEVRNPRDAYAALQVYEGNPAFCILLATLFDAESCPVPNLPLPVPWRVYRQLAGLTLKNHLARTAAAPDTPSNPTAQNPSSEASTRHSAPAPAPASAPSPSQTQTSAHWASECLRLAAIRSAGACAIRALRTPPDAQLARTAGQLIAQVSVLTSLNWWAAEGLGDLAQLLLAELLPAGGLRSLAALYTLQFLMEDLPREVGEFSGVIVEAVATLARETTAALELRKAAFRVAFHLYEQAASLEWEVETLSPLQRGLVLGSGGFIETCTRLLGQDGAGDEPLRILVLRAAALLLDYFRYQPPPPTQAAAAGMAWAWLREPLRLLVVERDDRSLDERRAAALDLLTGILEFYEASAGEGETAFLATPLLRVAENAEEAPALESLVQGLVRFARMSDDEAESILANDDYRVRELGNGAVAAVAGFSPANWHNPQPVDLAQDDRLEEEEAAMSLRRAALRCLNALSLFAPAETFAAALGRLTELWGRPGWREREAGIVLLGTLAAGCAAQLSSVLPGVLDHLLHFLQDPAEHPCVVSIALWTFSRLLPSILTDAPTGLDAGLQAALARMQSASRRVQYASVSAVKSIYWGLQAAGQAQHLQPHFPALVRALQACLPVYTGTNLTVLIDVAGLVMGGLAANPQDADAQAALNAIGNALTQEATTREAGFQTSVRETLIEPVPNAQLDLDLFSVHRGKVQFLAVRPDAQAALAGMVQWATLGADLAARALDQDVGLICGILTLAAGYGRLVPSALLRGWAGSGAAAGPFHAALNWLRRATSSLVQVAAAAWVELLVRGLAAPAQSSSPIPTQTSLTSSSTPTSAAAQQEEGAGPAALLGIPLSSLPALLEFLVSHAADSDSGLLRAQFTRLVAALLRAFPATLTAAGVVGPVLHALNHRVLRADVFGEVEPAYREVAFVLCQLVEAFPGYLSSFQIAPVCALLGRAPVDEPRVLACTRLYRGLCAASPQLSAAAIPPVVAFWVEDAALDDSDDEAAPDAAAEAGALLSQWATHCGPALQQGLEGYTKERLPGWFAAYL